MANIPAKQLIRSGSTADLSKTLLNRELGWDTSVSRLAIKISSRIVYVGVQSEASVTGSTYIEVTPSGAVYTVSLKTDEVAKTFATLTAVNGKADLSYVNTQLEGKASTSHAHTVSDISDFPASMPASDVAAWAKSPTKPTYTASEVGARSSSVAIVKSDLDATLQAALDNAANALTSYESIDALTGRLGNTYLKPSDLGDWAKSATKPSYSASEVTGAYSKSATGIPETDLDSGVTTALALARTSLQSYDKTQMMTVLDGAYLASTDISDWAKATTKPSYTAGEVGSLTSAEITALIDQKIAESASGKTKTVEVDELPETGDPTTIYYLKKTEGSSTYHEQYVWMDTGEGVYGWVSLGRTDVNLDNYYTKTETYSQAEITNFLNQKAAATHQHPWGDITGAPDFLVTTAISDWAKAANKPAYTASEVGALPADTHIPTDVTESTVSGWGFYKKPNSGIPSTDLSSEIQQILSSAVTTQTQATTLIGNYYALNTHTHGMNDIAGLADALSGKAASTHSHTTGDLTDWMTVSSTFAAASTVNELVSLTNPLKSGAAGQYLTKDADGNLAWGDGSSNPITVDTTELSTDTSHVPSSPLAKSAFVQRDASSGTPVTRMIAILGEPSSAAGYSNGDVILCIDTESDDSAEG